MQNSTGFFFQQVQQLDEFKKEEKRTDSINKIAPHSIKLSVEILDSSFFDEDKGKNISIAFINEQLPFEKRTMYTIKFDTNKKQIISINKDEMQFKKSVIDSPEDIVLPRKQ